MSAVADWLSSAGIGPDGDGVDIPAFESLAEYDAFLDRETETAHARWWFGQHIDHLCRGSGRFTARCQCGALSGLEYRLDPDGNPDLRETLTCPDCGLNARLRAVAHLLEALVADRETARLYLTEQCSPFYRWSRRRFPRVTGSEYFGEHSREKLSAYLRHLVSERERLNFEDVTALSHPDGTLDGIASCDVLEHVPDYRTALGEFARVLRKGGALVLTVPFLDRDLHSVTRAGIDGEGRVEHYLEPEYHGDPVRRDGVLAFYNFGWDLLDGVRDAGFEHAAWCLPFAPARGLFGPLWTLVARR